MITASGLGQFGGFTLFRVCPALSSALLCLPCLQRVMPTQLKKKMPAIAGRKGIWSMRISQDIRTSSKSSKGVSSAMDDNILFSTDATPAPASRVRRPSPCFIKLKCHQVASKSQAKLDVNITTRLPMLTVTCAPFFSKTHILQVTTNSLRLLSPGKCYHPSS